MESKNDIGLRLVLDAAKGPSKLARKLGDVSPQAISQWKQVPATRVLDVSVATGVACHLIRPDIYPAPISDGGENVSPRKSAEVTQ
jgi:DNA-binding transcriptional regulator YdaS (Cro superfamily)